MHHYETSTTLVVLEAHGYKKYFGDDSHTNGDCPGYVHCLEDSDIQGILTVREIETILWMGIVQEIVTV